MPNPFLPSRPDWMHAALRALPAALGVAVALALPGCARHQTEAGAAARASTLILGNGAEPEDLDPQVVTAYTDQNILLGLFEGLTAIDERTSAAVPAAAASWEASPDGLVWTFHLRPGLRWSNGEPLTAPDFIASWRRILSPALGAGYAYLLYPVINAEAYNAGRLADPGALGFSAPDPLTLRLRLARPTPYLPVLVAQPAWFPVNPRVIAKFGALSAHGTAWTRPGNLVGNGPFTLAEWTPNARVVLERNPAYRDAAAVSLSRLVFLPWDSPDAEERAFRAGQVHVTFALPPARIPAYRDDGRGLLRADPFLQVFFLRFNATRAPFDDPRVRRALSLAIPRAAICRAGLVGASGPAATFVPEGCGGYVPAPAVPTDYARARSLLAAAGHAGGAGLPSFEVQARSDDVQPRVMEAIQAAWARELGVHATITSLEQKTWLQNQQNLAYAVSTAGWAGDFPDPVTFLDLFVTGGGNNWTGWGSPRYDALIDAAAHLPGGPSRDAVFREAETLLLSEGPVAPLYFGTRTYLIDPSVRGWEPALLGFHRYAGVSLAPPP